MVENLALQAGLKKGGAAKGELVLAIFELANCFRHGWGIPKDPVAAKQYYETAANLGDTGMLSDSIRGSMRMPMLLLLSCLRDAQRRQNEHLLTSRFLLRTTDAMNEVAWCYVEGFGTKKDKVSWAPCAISLTSCIPGITITGVILNLASSVSHSQAPWLPDEVSLIEAIKGHAA